MRRVLCVLLILMFYSLWDGIAQTYISVPVGDRVYMILEIAQIRGVVSNLSAVKPYTSRSVQNFLEDILDDAGSFTLYEHAILSSIVDNYRIEPEAIHFYLGQQSAYRSALSDVADFHTNNATILNLGADMFG